MGVPLYKGTSIYRDTPIQWVVNLIVPILIIAIVAQIVVFARFAES